MPEEVKKGKLVYVFWGTIILIVIFLGANLFLWFGTQHSTSSTQLAQPSPMPKEAIVILTKDGFSPAIVTIAKDSAVRWVNQSGQLGTVNSDDHPTHQKFRELNLGNFSGGGSLVHIFPHPGTYTYHNHVHPEEKGTVIVK